MSTKNEFRLAIEQIQKYSDSLGYESTHLGERDGDNESIEDIEITLPENSLYVTGSPGMKYFQMSTSYNYVEAVAGGIEKNKIQRNIPNEKGYEPGSDTDVTNVRYVAEEMVREAEFTELLSDGLSLFVTTDKVECIGEKREDIGFSGFGVKTTIFPFGSKFSIRTLDRSIDAIILAAQRGHAYLRLASSVQDPNQTESGRYELVVEPGWHTNWK